MTCGESFDMAEEFAGVDFNEERLEKRLRKTMETLAKYTQRSIYGSCANRSGQGYLQSARQRKVRPE